MAPIHVLQMIDGLNVGGAEVLLRDLARGLQGERYRVSVCYSTPGPLAAQIAAQGVPLYRLPRLARIDPLLFGGMVATIRRLRPQIVHTHLFKSDFHGRVAARLCGVPVVVSTLHNSSDWAKNPLMGRLYGLTARAADRLIAVSEEVGAFSAERFFIDPQKIVSIRNGVPVERFRGQEAAGLALRAELGVPADAPLVGVLARLTTQKDHATFLRAAAQIRQAVPAARFLIAGDGELRADLERQAAELGLGAAAIFTGVRSDVPAILAAIDLLAFSSAWEGLPVALLEGMASARPVVSTAVGGVPGVLLDGVTGLLVPPADPAALAAACLRVLGDPGLGQRLGQAGRERVEAHYSIGAMIQQTSDLYEMLLQKHGLGMARPNVAN
jgi:glycosyltransferase involved in cell wall biosynthesis